MKVRDVVREIEKDGWRFYSQKGSHRQYVHPVMGGRVTIAGKPGDDMTLKPWHPYTGKHRLESRRRRTNEIRHRD
jgi:predicted RNA binding protein YcfA (HicA-like mRNA interferase family)